MMNRSMPITPSAVVSRTAVAGRPGRPTGRRTRGVMVSAAANTTKNNAATASALMVVVTHGQREPVVRRSFPHLDPEHDHADQQQPPVRPAACPLREAFAAARRGSGLGLLRHRDRDRPRTGMCAQRRSSTASPANCQATEMCSAAQPAPSPAPITAPADHARVHERHQRAAGFPFDRRALDVDHDVERADAQPDQDETDRRHDQRSAPHPHRCRSSPADRQSARARRGYRHGHQPGKDRRRGSRLRQTRRP